MKSFLPVALGVACLCSACCSFVRAGEQEGGDDKKVLLKAVIVNVNGVKIIKNDMDEMVQYFYHRKYGEHPPAISSDEAEALYNAAVVELIKIELINDEAKIKDVKLEDSMVDRQLRRMRVNPVEASPVERKIAASEMSFDKLLALEGHPPYRPSPKQIREYYQKNLDQFRSNCMVIVRSIFLRAETAEEAAKVQEKTDMLRESILKQPEDKRQEYFAAVAKEYSQDAYSANGGLIRISRDEQGWFPQSLINERPGEKPGEKQEIFPEQMYKAIEGLATKGEVTEVCRSNRGFHILYLQDIKGGDLMPFDKAVEIIQYIFEQKERVVYLQKWLKEKWERSEVTWHDGEPYPLDNLLAPLREQQSKTGGDHIK